MADKTLISWTDSTFNAWWGCTAVSPGCDHCYAEALDRRTGGGHWGAGTLAKSLSDANWKKPHTWNRKAGKTGDRQKVFSGSMCDLFDKNAPEGQRERLWQVVRETPNLDWQLLTKRAPNIVKYLPDDWQSGYENVWLGVTVENVKHGKPRIDVLRNTPAKVRFLSVEPLIEDIGELDLSDIHWLIVGGESGPGCRPMNLEWARDIRRQCKEQHVPFFFKQAGGLRGGSHLLDGVEAKQWPQELP